MSDDVLRLVDFVVACVEQRRGRLGVSELGELVATVDLVYRGYSKPRGECTGSSASGVDVLGAVADGSGTSACGVGEQVGGVEACPGAVPRRGGDTGTRFFSDTGVVEGDLMRAAFVAVAGRGANYQRNKKARERRRRKAQGARVSGVSGGSVASLPPRLGDVIDAEQAERLVKQRGALYELRNEREALRLRREISMEKATLEAGANDLRVDNWIADVRSGSSGTMSSRSGGFKRSHRGARSAGSWRAKTVTTEGSSTSVVSEEKFNALLAEKLKVDEDLAEARRDTERVKLVVSSMEREVDELVKKKTGPSGRHADVVDLFTVWDERR